MIYMSLANDKVKFLKKLGSKKFRDDSNKFLVEGIHAVLEAIKKGKVDEVFLVVGSNLAIPFNKVSYVSTEIMSSLSFLESSTDVIALVNKKDEVLSIGNKVIVLDNIQDPGNLGTIIRSAAAFGFSDIFLSDNSADLYNSKVLRATKGMIFSTNIIRGNITEFLNDKEGYIIYGTDVENGEDIKAIKDNDKLIVVMGNEGHGISKEVSDLCNKFIYINMNSAAESLNVGVAASIIMYELGDK